jgi:hypothetical protein
VGGFENMFLVRAKERFVSGFGNSTFVAGVSTIEQPRVMAFSYI